MDLMFKSEYTTKNFNGENLNVFQLKAVKLNKTTDVNGFEKSEEVETSTIDIFIKKNKHGELCLFADNGLLTHINKVAGKINPFFVLTLQMIIPMFKPIQCKIDLNDFKIVELIFNTQQIDINDNFTSESLINNFSGLKQMTGLFGSKITSQNNIAPTSELNSEVNLGPHNKSTFNFLSESSSESGSESESKSESESESESGSESKSESESESESESGSESKSGSESGQKKNIFNQNELNQDELNNLIKMLSCNENNLLNMFGGLNELGGLGGLGEINELDELKGLGGLSGIFDILNDKEKIMDGTNFNCDKLIESNNQNNQENTNNLDELVKPNKSNTTVINKLKNIWTNDYYENENLDDFLISDTDTDNNDNTDNNDKTDNIDDNDENNDEDVDFEEENKSKYLGYNFSDICLELNLTNLTNLKLYKELINENINEKFFEEQIKLCEGNMSNVSNISNISGYNIPGIKKWVEIDSNGEKYIAYCLGNSEESYPKTFRYEHLKQLKTIMFDFIDCIEMINEKNS